MAEIKIIGVRIIETAPIGANLLIVRIDTNQPGLYGYGCATFTQRHKAVAAAVMEYFPLHSDRQGCAQPAGCLAGASRLLLLARRSRLELRAVRR